MITLKKIYINIYLIFIFLIIFNVNGLIFLFSGITSFISPIILIFAIYLIIGSKEYHYSKLLQLYILFIFLYITVGSIVLLFSNVIGEYAYKTIFDVVTSLIVVIATYSGYRKIQPFLKNALFLKVAWAIILSVFTSYLFNYLGISDHIQYRQVQRLSGIFANPNELAAQSLFAIICIQYIFNTSSIRLFKLLLLTFMLIICFSVMVLAFSRSIFVAFILLVLIQLFYFSRLNLKSVLVSILIIAAISISAPIYYDSIDNSTKKRIDRSLNILDGEVTDENTGDRVKLAGNALILIQEKPFFGQGIGLMQNMPGSIGTHNAYLAVLGNSGIFVFLIFLTFLYVLIKHAFIYYKKTKNYTFLFIIIAILINGITKTGVFEFKINNVLFGLAIAIFSITAQETKDNKY